MPRVRLNSGTLREEFGLTMLDNVSEVVGSFALGFSIEIDIDGRMVRMGSTNFPSSAFGFNRCTIAAFFVSHPGGNLYRLLLQMIATGSDLDADDTPPVFSMSRNHKGAIEHFARLDSIMNNLFEREARDWISEARKGPPFFPLHVKPL